jgi:amino acid transporter
VYIRILLFYIGGVLVIGLLVPSNDPGLALGNGTAAASPFVIAIKRSGIKALPGVSFVSFVLGPPFAESS